MARINPLPAALACAIGVLAWAYWNTLGVASKFWNEPGYSHAWLTAVGAALLLWKRWPDAASASAGDAAGGALLLAAAAAARLIATHYHSVTPGMFSLPLALGGAVWLIGGRAAFSKALPAIVLLGFIFPFPGLVTQPLSSLLQRWAAAGGLYVLQLSGVGAYGAGTTIFIGDTQLEVTAACGGLSMFTVLIGLAVFMAFWEERPAWERAVLIASSLPVAVAANIVRITLTGWACAWWGAGAEAGFTHDAAGYVMAVIAVALLKLETLFLKRLFIEADDFGPPPEPQAAKTDERAMPAWPPAWRLALAVVLVAPAAIVQGLWSERWAGTTQAQRLAERLEEVPYRLGPWIGADVSGPGDAQLSGAGAVGSLARAYTHVAGASVTVFILCGELRPLLGHTPQECYPAIGFELLGEPAIQAWDRVGEFKWARFAKSGPAAQTALRIYWSWMTDDRWLASQSPRRDFAGAQAVYKIYVIAADAPGNPNAGAQFLAEAGLQLTEALGGPPAAHAIP